MILIHVLQNSQRLITYNWLKICKLTVFHTSVCFHPSHIISSSLRRWFSRSAMEPEQVAVRHLCLIRHGGQQLRAQIPPAYIVLTCILLPRWCAWAPSPIENTQDWNRDRVSQHIFLWRLLLTEFGQIPRTHKYFVMWSWATYSDNQDTRCNKYNTNVRINGIKGRL